ncbi:hypothetical protein LINPERHAP2_LOCUS41463 [Linum perenne]
MEVENQNRERLRLQDSVAQWDSLSGAFVSGNYKVLLYVTDFKDPNLDVKTLSLSRGNHTHGKKLYLRLDNRRLGINFGHVYCLNMETHEWKVFIDDGHINKLAYWTRFAIWQKADGNVHDNLHIWFEREFLQFADSDYSSDDDDDCFDHADGSFSDLDDNPLADDGIAAECLKLADKGLKSKPRAIEPLLELANEYGLFRDTPILPSAQCEDKYCLKHLLNFERGPPLTWIHDRIRFCWSWTGGYVIPRLRTGDEKLCLDVENLDSDDHMVPLSLTPESTKMTDFLNEKDVTVVHGILAPLGENKYDFASLGWLRDLLMPNTSCIS